MDKEDQIKKWLNDELTPNEKKLFEHGEDFLFYQAVIDGGQQFKASNFSEPKSFNDFKSAYETKNETARRLDWFKPMLRVASILVITLGVYFTFFNNNVTQVKTLASQKTTIELPDQSKVTLNADSKIEFSTRDWKNNRSLNLSGEAYFKVAKGKKFDVITSRGSVAVVGTAFNVKQRDSYFEVQCFEGIVSVTSGTHTKKLLAGYTFRILDSLFSQDHIMILKPKWVSNNSTFKALPYKTVLSELERQYDIEIFVKDVDTERLFTGGFMHDNIENALISITQPMDLAYKMNASNDVVIYGSKK
ncbi:FecR family protein [Psychroserpens burtonensis]|uniref:FecR family protein n=1 Tax=Psychroserpens burtonensis TaxID=49278 RepID=A0A5C7BJ44_9FLAO|nr:FecR family protein [Psychroserpens burtonensis]TXE20001.1 FecR family protein [Psychroserpens burtonensis]